MSALIKKSTALFAGLGFSSFLLFPQWQAYTEASHREKLRLLSEHGKLVDQL